MRIVWNKPRNVPSETKFTDFLPDQTYHNARDEGREYEAQLTLEATGKHLRMPKTILRRPVPLPVAERTAHPDTGPVLTQFNMSQFNLTQFK